MTAAKIAALTACRVDGCTASIHRRELCVRHYERTKLLVREGASWTDDAATLADLWRARRERIRAEQRERGLTNMLGKRAAPVAPAAPTATPEPDRSGWPEIAADIMALEAKIDRTAWPVLVLDGVDYYRWPTVTARGAVWLDADTGLWMAYRDSLQAQSVGDGFPSAALAAEALGARLPEADAIQARLPDGEAAPAPPADVTDAVHVITSPTGPSGFRCLTRSTSNGERCIKELLRMSNGDLIHSGGHVFVAGDTTETLADVAGLREQAEVGGRMLDDICQRTLADITERAAALGMPAGLHVGTWWSTQLTEARERAREMEARANEAAAECERLRAPPLVRELAALRTVVREAMEACDRAGVHEGLTPAKRIDVLVCQRNLADHALADARERLERARARWGSVRDSSHAASRLRAAIADALDIEGPVPPDYELVRRLRELDTDDDRDLAVVRDVIGACTGGLRRLAYDSHPPSPVAVDALCAVLERTVGVVRG